VGQHTGEQGPKTLVCVCVDVLLSADMAWMMYATRSSAFVCAIFES
jgi:hypothetical protein